MIYRTEHMKQNEIDLNEFVKKQFPGSTNHVLLVTDGKWIYRIGKQDMSNDGLIYEGLTCVRMNIVSSMFHTLDSRISKFFGDRNND